ncbi:hypothetical protein F5J12DRAFT_147172 [Pisolithus orientalis]|uniref:uncharacterized protein n=1 Tax=Pisolithus orientalis TaxID=936130 RepID=UPI002223F032|nr:uncharacterized protein F5J12DRAFT_147172 [Pisolithus orientalis]KAI6004496.1 hypothetical protein F5J12DRAFT_147172 [Pisolithus orientalis]
MDELAQARAELARLQSTERMLFKDPLAVRVAVETQSRKISELANTQPSQIKRLPVELLTRTFSFLLARGREDPYIFFHCLPLWRNDLAGVSRLWRDLILDTPSFWSDIGLIYESNSKSLMTQLKRSREYPLDITILDPRDFTLDALLNVLIPSANRWRSLHVGCLDPSDLDTIMNKFCRLEFPCLEDVSVGDHQRCVSLARVPAVRGRDTRQVDVFKRIAALSPTLTTLRLSIKGEGNIHDQSFFKRIPTQSLTMLTFTCRDRWVLKPNSLHFPLLERLVIDTLNPHDFMNAIVTPKLQHFDYCHPRGSIIGPFGLKFSHVPYLTLKVTDKDDFSDMENSSEAHMLCEAFPRVRHAILRANDIDPLFIAMSPYDNLGSQTPVDSWESLEQLSIIIHHNDRYWEVDTLAEWLTKRQKLGRPSLHVQLVGLQTNSLEIKPFSRIYKRLRNCCTLDLLGVRLRQRRHTINHSFDSYFSLTTDSDSLYIRVGNHADRVVLNNWRGVSLENMDVSWPPNGRPSLSESDMLCSNPQEQAFLDDADSDCDSDYSTQMSLRSSSRERHELICIRRRFDFHAILFPRTVASPRYRRSQ